MARRFRSAQNEAAIWRRSPRDGNSTISNRQSPIFRGVSCQFVTDDSEGLRCVRFKQQFGSFDTDPRAVASAVGREFFADKFMQFCTSPVCNSTNKRCTFRESLNATLD